MTEIMPVPRNLILLSYQQGAYAVSVLLSRDLNAQAVRSGDTALIAAIAGGAQ